MIDFSKFEVLAFDCYGTLIDWETGIVQSLQPILNNHKINLNKKQILQDYAKFESSVEKGEYCEYKEILKTVLKKFGGKFNFIPDNKELDAFSCSVKDWPAFSDTTEALKNLKEKFKLAIISNVDDDLFEFSNNKLKVKFDWIITAQQVKTYKPNLKNFHFAVDKIGLPREKILHVAQSLYHDIGPAKKVNLTTVWVNRRKNKNGFGATPPTSATPDLEVPDLGTLSNLINQSI